jgi:hypothetical protein
MDRALIFTSNLPELADSLRIGLRRHLPNRGRNAGRTPESPGGRPERPSCFSIACRTLPVTTSKFGVAALGRTAADGGPPAGYARQLEGLRPAYRKSNRPEFRAVYEYSRIAVLRGWDGGTVRAGGGIPANVNSRACRGIYAGCLDQMARTIGPGASSTPTAAAVSGWPGRSRSGAILRAIRRCGSTFWLGGRDSNPDTQIQSLQSYR